jgi:predicted ATPase
MLKSIHLKFGSSETQAPLEFDLESVTVFVGPNNSGKSRALREIESLMLTGRQAEYVIVETLKPSISSREEAKELIESRFIKSTVGNVPPEGHVLVARTDLVHSSRSETFLLKERILDAVCQMTQGSVEYDSYVLENLLSLFVIRLDGRTRFALTEPKQSGDLSGPPQNHLMALFQDEEARR